MSLNMYLGEVQAQTQSMNAMCTATIQGMEQAINSIDAFVFDAVLQGQTYDSAKTFFAQTFRPLAQGIIYLCEELIRQNDAFPNDFQSQVASTDVIEQEIREQMQGIDQTKAGMEGISSTLPAMQVMVNIFDAMKQKLQEKLDHLYQFNATSSSKYDTALQLAASIAQGLAEVQSGKGFSAVSGTFSTQGLNMEWTGPIQKITEDKAREVESLNKDSESGEVDKKDSFLGMTGFNWKAPVDGWGNTVGTVTGAAAVIEKANKVINGYKVIYDLDRRAQRVLVTEHYGFKGSKNRDYKIYYVDDVAAKMKNGTASKTIKEVDALIKSGSVLSASKMALKDRLGWASVAIDSYTDTSENIKNNESSDKIAGDIIGNVVVGGAVTVGATALTALALPAAPVLAVAAAGFVFSVGLTYFTEGVKWDVDLDGDGEDDTIKDMVKTGSKKAWSTVAGWFN
ncbi:T7SS effector LXG polymorphic toxin [Bacillus sp. 491mf]|uniref:T7SS effector LXG polymorphic toxin n=1 Tax=Bacillus sp. 491mf TaxID=1761755 RepID=UPI000B8706C4|nr:T7SS effector LXG polymorphic toxin [Bacillus sp. 491mf]